MILIVPHGLRSRLFWMKNVDCQWLLQPDGDHREKLMEASRYEEWSQRMNPQLFSFFQMVLPKKRASLICYACCIDPRGNTAELSFLIKRFYWGIYDSVCTLLAILRCQMFIITFHPFFHFVEPKLLQNILRTSCWISKSFLNLTMFVLLNFV